MSSLQLATVGLLALISLLVIRIPVGIAMLTVGIFGYVALSGLDPVLAYMKTAAFWQFASYDFCVIPIKFVFAEKIANFHVDKLHKFRVVAFK